MATGALRRLSDEDLARALELAKKSETKTKAALTFFSKQLRAARPA